MTPLAVLAALAFAAARGTVLLMYDTIADRPREWLTSRSQFAKELLGCPYCTGFWCSAAALAVWLSVAGWSIDGKGWPVTVLLHGVELFAVAGGQMILNQLDTLLLKANEREAD